MGRSQWIAAIALFPGLTGGCEAAAQPSIPLTLQVRVDNDAGIPTDTLAQAQQQASRIFGAAGITLAWLPGRTLPPGSLILKIAQGPIGRTSNWQSVLGLAPRSGKEHGRLAWLFYRRIEMLAGFHGVGVAMILGPLMAHEMGHLLLPYGSHAASGLMKGGWDSQQTLLATTGGLTFEKSQAALIRKRLATVSDR